MRETQTPERADYTGILYKYTDHTGAKKILSNRTLKFTRPSEMYDPFDVYIDDIFGMDLEEVFANSTAAFADMIITTRGSLPRFVVSIWPLRRAGPPR